ncbi:transposase, partial [Mycobacterium tuberculosis BTB13-127]
MSGGSSRRYP